jgi:glycosyltransferase involved in cell wall biosynthesis
VRIGLVTANTEGAWGGSEELWSEMGRLAVDHGHEVFACVATGAEEHQEIRKLQSRGVALYIRDYRPKRMGRLRDRLFGTDVAWKRFVARSPEVLLLSQGSTYSFTQKADFRFFLDWLERSGVPYVVISHGGWEFEIPSRELALRTLRFMEQASELGFVSERNIRVVERQLASRLRRATVVRNPVKLNLEGALPWPQDTTPQFGCVCRLDAAVKGLDLLFEVLSGDSWRGRPWRLDLAGDGPHRDYLPALATFFGIRDRVRFLGHVGEVGEFWSTRHILMAPSRTEGLPLALIEAMLCGRPAVATDVGGVPEVVRDGETGFVAAPASLGALRDALERAWAARASWPQMGRAGRLRAMAVCDPGFPARLLRRLESLEMSSAPLRARSGDRST